MKLTKSKLREIIQEVIDEIEEEEQDVDEATTTGNVSGYQTPNAFSTSDEPDDEYVDRLNRSTGYKRVNEDIDIVDKKFNIGKVTDSTGDDWYVKKIDSTHMFMANDPKYLKKDKPTGVMAHHIGQHRDAIYYKDLKKWLKSTNEINESHDGLTKKQINESQVSKTESSDLKKIISYFEKKYPEFDPWYDGMGTFTLSLDEDVNYFINIEGKSDFDIMFFDEVKNKRKSLGDELDYRKAIKVIERFISRPEIKKVIGESTGYTRVNEAHDGLTKKQIKKELEFIDRLLNKANLSNKQHKDAVKEKERLESLLNESAKVSDWTRLEKEQEEKKYKNRWLELKNSDQTPNQKIGIGVREIRKELAEMEKFVNWYSKIRSMNELGKDDYWKRTQRHLKKIKERLIGFANKIQELDKPLGE